jgi:HAD superfamily hydrolase (TIGR01509 family)
MIQTAIRNYLSATGHSALNIKAVMFDMDGVIFNSMPLHAKAWVKAFAECGIQFSEYQVYLNEGRTGASTIDEQFQKYFNRHSTPDEQREIYRIKSGFFRQMPAPGLICNITDVVDYLAKNNIARTIVTGSGESSTLERIENLFNGRFSRELMVTALDVKQGKPNPEPYLMGLHKLGVAPNEAMVVENAPLGIMAGVAAGVFTIGVNTGILAKSDLISAGANLVFDNMQQLLDAMPELAKFHTLE